MTAHPIPNGQTSKQTSAAGSGTRRGASAENGSRSAGQNTGHNDGHDPRPGGTIARLTIAVQIVRRACSVCQKPLKPESTICKRGVALTNLKQRRGGLTTGKSKLPSCQTACTNQTAIVYRDSQYGYCTTRPGYVSPRKVFPV